MHLCIVSKHVTIYGNYFFSSTPMILIPMVSFKVLIIWDALVQSNGFERILPEMSHNLYLWQLLQSLFMTSKIIQISNTDRDPLSFVLPISMTCQIALGVKSQIIILPAKYQYGGLITQPLPVGLKTYIRLVNHLGTYFF